MRFHLRATIGLDTVKTKQKLPAGFLVTFRLWASINIGNIISTNHIMHWSSCCAYLRSISRHRPGSRSQFPVRETWKFHEIPRNGNYHQLRGVSLCFGFLSLGLDHFHTCGDLWWLLGYRHRFPPKNDTHWGWLHIFTSNDLDTY